jgi:hypothetical protein
MIGIVLMVRFVEIVKIVEMVWIVEMVALGGIPLARLHLDGAANHRTAE